MIIINKGQNLNLEDFRQVLFANASLEYSDEILQQVEDNFLFLKKYAENKIIYGINTGLGPMARITASRAFLPNSWLELALPYSVVKYGIDRSNTRLSTGVLA